MQPAGSYQADTRRQAAPAKTQRRSYMFRVGQVESILLISSKVTIYDLAREIGIGHRQMYDICDRMKCEGRITSQTVTHSNTYKYLISLAKK